MTVKLRRGLSLFCGLGLVASPRVVEACAVCLSATDGTREAYYGTTALLIALPFLLLGSIVGWLYRASRAQARLERERGDTEVRSSVHSGPLAHR